MARIRTIKPETAESQSLGRVSRDARLLFILCWTLADDDGRLRAAPAALAGRLFPFDRDASKMIGGWIDELEKTGHVHRYQVAGNDYMLIAEWAKHQKIDHPTKSRLPAPPSEILAGSREIIREEASGSPTLAPDLGPRTEDQGKNTGRAASPQRPARVKAELEEFEKFWAVWPNKVKKPAAQKAWPKALAAAGSADVIVAGVERYKRTKPDWQNWPHPATWLNNQQWADEGLTDGQAPLSEAERTRIHADRERLENCSICRGQGMVALRYGARHGHLAGRDVSTRCPHDAAKLREFCVRGGYEWPDDPEKTVVKPKNAHQPSMLMPIGGDVEKTSENIAGSREENRETPSESEPPKTLDIPPFLRRSA